LVEQNSCCDFNPPRTIISIVLQLAPPLSFRKLMRVLLDLLILPNCVGDSVSGIAENEASDRNLKKPECTNLRETNAKLSTEARNYVVNESLRKKT